MDDKINDACPEAPEKETPSHTLCCSWLPPHTTSKGETGEPSLSMSHEYPGCMAGVNSYINDSGSRVLVLLNHWKVMSMLEVPGLESAIQRQNARVEVM